MGDMFRKLVFENASGKQVVLNDSTIKQYFEVGTRSGFTAPEVELITQKYINGKEKIIGRILKPRVVTMTFIIVGGSAAKRDSVFFDMIEKLIDVSGGDVGKLYIKRSDGKTVYLNCAYSSGLSVVEQYEKYHRFTLEFYASDPYFYNDFQFTTQLNDTESDIVTLADDLYLGVWYLGIGNINGNGVIVNQLEEDAYPIIKIRGRRQDITITNQTTNERIAFTNLPMFRGDTLVIDTREQSKDAHIEKEDGTVISALQYLDWETMNLSLRLVPGSNGIVWSGYGEIQPITFSYSQQFISA